jgi:hypothetical protein
MVYEKVSLLKPNCYMWAFFSKFVEGKNVTLKVGVGGQ